MAQVLQYRHVTYDLGTRASQVIQRQHRVGLAAAEAGLELDYRIAALVCKAPQRRLQEVTNATRYVCALEKLAGV